MDAATLALVGIGAYALGQKREPTSYQPTPTPPNLSVTNPPPAAPPGVDVGALIAQYGPAALEIIANLTNAWARSQAQGSGTPTVPMTMNNYGIPVSEFYA